jgi:selenocysteine lyase/cysteine desulfurase
MDSSLLTGDGVKSFRINHRTEFHPRMSSRIYLDHAATRFPKPSVVIETVRQFSLHEEAAVGRGAYRASLNAGKIVDQLRKQLASWIDAESKAEVAIFHGGTSALNAALFGILKPGDHVVTTEAEHNSVLRPLKYLESEGQISWTLVPADDRGQVDPTTLLDAVTEATRLVAVVHAANVNGVVQPVGQIGRMLTDRFPSDEKPTLLCDAAQTFGHLPLSVREAAIDLLAAPGHKGGCGPLGTGFLYARKSIQPRLRPTTLGGTGSFSESLEIPNDFPTAFEAGNMNVPALAGWSAGLAERTRDRTPNEALRTTAAKLQPMATELYRRLAHIDQVKLIGPPKTPQLPVASIAIDGMPASEIATILDVEFGIEVRSGLHCAALIHHAIGSPEDGTVRISCGETTTTEELHALETALREITAAV